MTPLPLPFPLFDANTTAGGEPLGNLPDWDLSDLYAGEDAPELDRDWACLLYTSPSPRDRG